jgi:L-aminopeptidase/D-esterase-like protein
VTITRVPGIMVGHAEVPGGGSGCTVVLGPFRAAVEVTGMATGTRELGTLAPEHLVPAADAIVLSGGSAYGLAAAHGVMAWLAERGRGYPTGADVVPIVPAAILYDLAADRSRPDAATGHAACMAASDAPVPEGRVGAGAGATVGKVAGTPMPGGVGSFAVEVAGVTVGAIAAVNAVGDVLGPDGAIVAGGRDERGAFVDASRFLREQPPEGEFAEWRDASGSGAAPRPGPREGQNTTLCMVATDAPLSKRELQRLVRMAATALPRRIRPVNTPFDGDVVFAASTAEEVREVSSGALLALGDAARAALEEAITRAVLPDGERDGV